MKFGWTRVSVDGLILIYNCFQGSDFKMKKTPSAMAMILLFVFGYAFAIQIDKIK